MCDSCHASDQDHAPAWRCYLDQRKHHNIGGIDWIFVYSRRIVGLDHDATGGITTRQHSQEPTLSSILVLSRCTSRWCAWLIELRTKPAAALVYSQETAMKNKFTYSISMAAVVAILYM
jgi:hypothetical protein